MLRAVLVNIDEQKRVLGGGVPRPCGMLCSVLVNIDQQKRVINNFCYESENIVFSIFNLTESVLFILYPY